jgi:hypothetical protein
VITEPTAISSRRRISARWRAACWDAIRSRARDLAGAVPRRADAALDGPDVRVRATCVLLGQRAPDLVRRGLSY